MRVSVSRLTVGRRGPTRSVDEHLRPPARRSGRGTVELQVCPIVDTGDDLEHLLVAVGAEAAGDDPVGLVLYGHTLLAPRFGAPPGTTDRIRAGLGLSGVPFFGISQVGGTSVLRAMDYAQRYLHRQAAYHLPELSSVLVLGGDHGGIVDSARHDPGMTFLADAAVAFLVRPDPDGRAGRYAYLGGATRRDPRFHRGRRMDPAQRRLFERVCGEQVLAVAEDALGMAGLTAADVRWVLPPADTALSWPTFARHAGLPADRVRLDMIPAGGHTLGVDALVALANAERAGLLSPGDHCLLVGIGEGAYFQAAVVRVTAERARADR